jgi:hypothetical protein
MQEMQRRAAVAGQIGMMRLADRVAARAENDSTSIFRIAWVPIIGLLVIGAAAAFIWCKRSGHNGFSGQIEFIRTIGGFKIGINLGCY